MFTKQPSLHASRTQAAIGRPSCLHRSRHRWCIAASAECSSTTNNGGGSIFFDRKDEMGSLTARCSAEPSSITLIVGPRSAGKSALLSEYMQRRGLAGSKCLADGRAGQLASPTALATELQRAALPKFVQQLFPPKTTILKTLQRAFDATQEKLKWGGSEITISFKAFSAVLQAFQGGSNQAEQAMPLQDVIDVYMALINLWKQRQLDGSLEDTTPPLLVLDEANKLMMWGDEHQKDRVELMDFFVKITKEKKLCHVVLATSEYAFQGWLSDGEVPAVRFVKGLVHALTMNACRVFSGQMRLASWAQTWM